MDYECSLYTVTDTNLRKVSIWEKNQGQNILDFLREDLSVSNVNFFVKFSRLT